MGTLRHMITWFFPLSCLSSFSAFLIQCMVLPPASIFLKPNKLPPPRFSPNSTSTLNAFTRTGLPISFVLHHNSQALLVAR